MAAIAGTLALIKIGNVGLPLPFMGSEIKMTPVNDAVQEDNVKEREEKADMIAPPDLPEVVVEMPVEPPDEMQIPDLTVPIDMDLPEMVHVETWEMELMLPLVEAPPKQAARSQPPRSAAPAAQRKDTSTPAKLARYKDTPRPPYPRSAKKAGLEGVVILLINVGKDGLPKRVTIAKSSGIAILDETSVRWVSQNWTFYPAVNAEDLPVACDVRAPVRFHLN